MGAVHTVISKCRQKREGPVNEESGPVVLVHIGQDLFLFEEDEFYENYERVPSRSLVTYRPKTNPPQAYRWDSFLCSREIQHVKSFFRYSDTRNYRVSGIVYVSPSDVSPQGEHG